MVRVLPSTARGPYKRLSAFARTTTPLPTRPARTPLFAPAFDQVADVDPPLHLECLAKRRDPVDHARVRVLALRFGSRNQTCYDFPAAGDRGLLTALGPRNPFREPCLCF